MSNTRKTYRPGRPSRPQTDRDREREIEARLPDGPVVIEKKEQNGEVDDEEYETLFTTAAGEFLIRKKLRPNLGIRYLKLAREKGSAEASGEMLFAIIGEDAMNELADNEDIEEEQLDQIMAVVEYKLMAASKTSLGN